MLRRDQFVQRYAEQNNIKKLQTEMSELEKFIDTQLVDANALLQYINQNGLSGTNGLADSQYVTYSISNDAVHRDPSVLDNGVGRSGNNKQYAIWSSRLTDASNNNASQHPQYDLVMNGPVTGQIRVTLPENTNKNAAYMLLQRYLGPLVQDSSSINQTQLDTLGFWGRKPTLGSNNSTGAVLDPNAVQLYYDNTVNRFVMIFTL